MLIITRFSSITWSYMCNIDLYTTHNNMYSPQMLFYMLNHPRQIICFKVRGYKLEDGQWERQAYTVTHTTQTNVTHGLLNFGCSVLQCISKIMYMD